MPAKPKTYGAAHEAAVVMLDAARLADPDEHFPYKHDAVTALIAENPPMGPGIPDGIDGTQDTSRTVADYITSDIADASRDYIDAQAAFLSARSDDTQAAMDAARDRLVAARLDHRQNRGQGFTIGAAAPKAG
jgi:hypothetical protein